MAEGGRLHATRAKEILRGKKGRDHEGKRKKKTIMIVDMFHHAISRTT
jgi:hypothetical protein